MAQSLKSTPADATVARVRSDELRRLLEERRDVLRGELHGRLRGFRAAHEARPHGEEDTGEAADADMQDDIQFSLLEMKAETLTKVEDALERLEAGAYGFCQVCERDIAEARLRALPFAARCQPCEAARESRVMEAQSQARRGAPLFEVLG